MTRCAIYARYSTDRQNERSAEDQVRDCRARAAREGWEVVEVYSDLAISGASNRRPGLNAMLADAATGAFDLVLAEALDRIARDQADIATFYKRLQFADVRIETLSEGAVNELHIGLKGTMGALHLKDLGDKIRRGQRGCLARGRVPGGLTYGYDVVRELGEDGQVEPGRRRVNEAQAAVVRRIVSDYVAGRSPKAIALQLNAEGVPAPRGGEWRASTIVGNRARGIGILHNPIYVGRYLYNRVTMKRDPETRNRVSRPTPADERQYADMPELRIVDDMLWREAQEAREVRAARPLVRRKRPRHLFSGLVRCGACGGGYTVLSGSRMGCTRAREAGTCANTRRIALAEVERRVLGGLETQLLSPEAVSLLVREYHAERDRRQRDDARGRAGLARKLRSAEAAVARLTDAIAAGGADFADLREAYGRKVEERDRARDALGEDAAAPVIALQPRVADAYRERVRRLVAAVETADPATSPDVAAAIRDLVDAIIVHPRSDGSHQVEVIGSFESALALATAAPSQRKGTRVAITTVAEDRCQRNRRRRSIMT